MAFSANALHNVHRYAASAQDIADAELNGTVVVGQIVALTGTNRLFYGFSPTLYKEFASPTDTISVTDSATIDLSYVGGEIVGSVKRSADANNFVELRADGIYVPTPVVPLDYIQSIEDTSSVDLTVDANGKLTAATKVSTTAGNIVTVNADGIYVAPNYVLSIEDTATVDLTVDVAGKLTAAAKLSTTAGNYATLEADGIYVPTPVVPLDYIRSIEDTSSVDLTVDANGKLTAASKISASAGNIVSVNADGIYVAPNFVQSVTDTVSIDLTVDANGSLKGDVNLAANGLLGNFVDGVGLLRKGSDTVSWATNATNQLEGIVNVVGSMANAIEVQPGAGLFVRKMTVDPSSIGLLEINSNNQISLTKQASIEVIVDPVSTSLAQFVANTALFATAGMGDYVYLPNAPQAERGWVTKVNAPATESDFIPVEYADYTQAQIRAMFSAGQGLVFNATTGVFSAKISTDASNDLQFGTDNGLYVDAATAPVGILKGSSTVTQTIEDTLNEIYARWYSADNGLHMDGLTTKLGGALLEDTIIDGDFDLTVHNTKFDGTNVDVLTGDVKFNSSTQGLLMKDSNGQYWKMTVNTAGQWLGVPFS